MFNNKITKKLLPVCVISALALGGLAGTIPNTYVQAEENKSNNAKIKNVIFLIGDGMGSTYTSGYRYFKDDSSTAAVERTVFDKYLVGQQMTYPEDPAQNVTDSAAAAPAMSAGTCGCARSPCTAPSG